MSVRNTIRRDVKAKNLLKMARVARTNIDLRVPRNARRRKRTTKSQKTLRKREITAERFARRSTMTLATVRIAPAVIRLVGRALRGSTSTRTKRRKSVRDLEVEIAEVKIEPIEAPTALRSLLGTLAQGPARETPRRPRKRAEITIGLVRNGETVQTSLTAATPMATVKLWIRQLRMLWNTRRDPKP